MNWKIPIIGALILVVVAGVGFLSAYRGFWPGLSQGLHIGANSTANLTRGQLRAFYDLDTGNLTSADATVLSQWYADNGNFNATAAQQRLEMIEARTTILDKLYSGQVLTDNEITTLNRIVNNLPSYGSMGFGRGYGKRFMPGMVGMGFRFRNGHRGPKVIPSPTPSD